MVAINRNMHLEAHDRVSIAHAHLAAAQSKVDRERPRRGETPSTEYLNALNSLVEATGEYGEAVAALGKMLSWKWSAAMPSERF